MNSYVFLLLFSACRLLQWIVAPTTSGRSEACRVVRVARSGCVHSVNNAGHDLGAALPSARCLMRQARRVIRFPAGLCAGVNAAYGRCFHRRLRAHFRLLTVTEGRQVGSERGGGRRYPVAPARCNFLPQARAIIVDRPTGLSIRVGWATAPLYGVSRRLFWH